MKSLKIVVIASVLAVLGMACDNRANLPDFEVGQPAQEEVSTEEQQIKTELFFGRSIYGGDVVTDSAWEAFRDNVLKDYFSGYTELDAQGYWTNGAGESESEQSKVIIYLHGNTASEYAKIDSVKTIYMNVFEQESVLQINTVVEAEF